jgi:Glycosyltransferase family 87
MPSSPELNRSQALAFTIGLAIAIFAVFGFIVQPPDRFTSDFYSFWAGGRLVGPELYNPTAAAAVQHTISPTVEKKRYIRPPFYAVALWPLSRLPFPAAYVVWQILLIAAAIAFGKLWSFEPSTYAVCAVFLPLGWSFGLGQDTALMLLILAAGATLIARKRAVAGGSILALCGIKPHLFVFVPVVLAAQRRYKAVAGMAATGAALYLISAAVLGFGWPAVFLHAATDNEATIAPRLLGVSGLLARFHAPVWVTPAAMLAGAAIVFVATRGKKWRPSLAFAVAAGAAFAPHALIYDAGLFLPLLILQVAPAVAVAIGAVFMTTVTPVAIISEVASLAVLWICRPRD